MLVTKSETAVVKSALGTPAIVMTSRKVMIK